MTAEYPNIPLLDYIFREHIQKFLDQNDRVYVLNVDVYVFPQTWPNTGGGFAQPGCVYGQSFIKEYTTVLMDMDHNFAMVAFGNKPAYMIQNPNQEFVDDFNKKLMKTKHEALRHYKEEDK